MAAKTTVPGLTVKFLKLGSYLYADIIHEATGSPAGIFSRQPLGIGKIAFCKRVDEVYGGVLDWTKKEFTEEELLKGSRARDILWNELVNNR